MKFSHSFVYPEEIGRGGGDIEEQSLWEEVEDRYS